MLIFLLWFLLECVSTHDRQASAPYTTCLSSPPFFPLVWVNSITDALRLSHSAKKIKFLSLMASRTHFTFLAERHTRFYPEEKEKGALAFCALVLSAFSRDSKRGNTVC
jgi:hypothetical protein